MEFNSSKETKSRLATMKEAWQNIRNLQRSERFNRPHKWEYLHSGRVQSRCGLDSLPILRLAIQHLRRLMKDASLQKFYSEVMSGSCLFFRLNNIWRRESLEDEVCGER